MQITLPPEAQAIIDRKLATGEFATVTDVIVSALEHFDIESTFIPDHYLVAARDQVARGEAVEVTEELRRQIREDVRAAYERGDVISDDVTY
jgi:Arc/MetJ-type ribon-helix-helix transcriptional regulator